jgi:predicted ester cyclase
MTGFDPEFQNLDQYIRVITRRIWDERRIDDIHKYYSDPCIVETPGAVSTAIEDVVSGTVASLGIFPDRRPLAEDVIQSGDAHGGFLSSHRGISAMTHLGDGIFGKASGRRVHAHAIADCVCKNNRIVHEWLVRDQAAIALHVGIEPRELALRWLRERGGWNKPVAGPAPGGYVSHVSDDPVARRYAATIQAFAGGRPNLAESYDDAVHHIGPGECTRYGHEEVGAYWSGLFASLQVQSFTVEHLAMQRGGGRADRAAMRWRVQAVHAGAGMFGSPTGRAVEILGINHVEFHEGKVLREWALVDDVVLWMQILAEQ